MEVKRMFVPLEKRGKGIGSIVLGELENWANELGYQKCILETGKKQPEAKPLDSETELAMEEIKAALALVSSKIKKGKQEGAQPFGPLIVWWMHHSASSLVWPFHANTAHVPRAAIAAAAPNSTVGII